MSQINKQVNAECQSPQVTSYSRENKRISTLLPQYSNGQGQQTYKPPFHKQSSKKRNTYTGVDNKSSPKQGVYKLTNNTERKILFILGFIEKFIVSYRQKKRLEEEMLLKKHLDRKKTLHLKNNSDFITIQPVSTQHINLEESYDFFIKIKTGLISIFKQTFMLENQRRKFKLIRMFSQNEDLHPIEETQKQNINKRTGQTKQSAFVTNLFNSTSLSQALPPVDLMAVSNFPQNMSQILLNSSKRSCKFRNLQHTKSRLRINPPINKYESRKKQEMRLFLQLDEKTQHLQNFRSDEGKLFKFNQNLKIMIKNVNLCRIVLLGRKNLIMQQFQKLNDVQCQNNQNFTLAILKDTSNLNRQSQESNSKQSHISAKQANSNIGTFNQNSSHSPYQYPSALKQKALRLKNYFQQSTFLLNSIQTFLLQFIKTDKAYQNYLKQNRLKTKLKIYKKSKQEERQKFYNDFVANCFHVSEIARLYFNALNQMSDQNISLKKVKMYNKEQLEKQNKVLMQLRYVLMYLQKECQNTTQTSLFRRTGSMVFTNSIAKISNINAVISQNISPRQRQTVPFGIRDNILLLDKKKSIKQSNLVLQKSVSQQTRIQKRNQSNIVIANKIIQPMTLLPIQSTQSNFFAKKYSKNRMNPVVKNKQVQEQKQVDINALWKTFYNKKFSSNAMRLRLF